MYYMTCKKYRNCKNVPCGETMNRCSPEYCYSKINSSSKNWSKCNMKKWNPKYKKYCKSERKCKINNTKKIIKNSVDALTLHNKMPYIWRYLKPNTRKHIINLSKMHINEINIPFYLWGKDNNKTKKKLEKKYKNI